MVRLYGRWINRWETRLATQDTNRVVRPFEWGAEWLDGVHHNGDAAQSVAAYVDHAVANSPEFFRPTHRPNFCLSGNVLTFPSCIESPFPENNIVHAGYFPAERHQKRAVVVLPQWNSDSNGHVGLCKLINKFGITALRVSLAYHDRRMPAELERADYCVSSNIGRTIHANRQSVLDVRCCLTWLAEQGYDRLAVLGTSLGSCVAFITACHDERLRAGVFNHVSTYFSDVVWTGLSTQHVRRGFDGRLTQDELRRYWSVISPATYMDRMGGRDFHSLLIWAPFDTTFLPQFSKQVVEGFRARKLSHEVFRLPCAHYTTGKFPFNWMDGLAMCRFLARKL